MPTLLIEGAVTGSTILVTHITPQGDQTHGPLQVYGSPVVNYEVPPHSRLVIRVSHPDFGAWFANLSVGERDYTLGVVQNHIRERLDFSMVKIVGPFKPPQVPVQRISVPAGRRRIQL